MVAVEQKIVSEVIDAIFREGYGILLNSCLPITQTRSALLSAMFVKSEDWIYVHKQGRVVGWVQFVYGSNNGEVIRSFHSNLDGIISTVYGLFAVGGYTLSLEPSSSAWNGRHFS